MPRSVTDPWTVTSACTAHCVSPGPTGSPATTARRYAAFTRVVTRAGVLDGAHLADPAVLRSRARAALAALGVRLHHTGVPLAPAPGTLVVANHISWLDALALLAAAPLRLLAKREVAAWPLIGTLTTRAGTLYINRTAPRELPRAVATVTATLRDGHSVAVFPEATTHCSSPGGTFRPALFQAAIDASAPVQPVTLTYHRGGHPSTAPAYVGDTAFTASLRHVARAAGLTVTVHAHPPILSHPHTRRSLAAAAQHTVHAPPPPATLTPVLPRLRSSGDRAPLS